MKKSILQSKKLFRSKKDRIIAGVCGGIGEYLEVDPTIVRIVFVLLTLAGGFPGIILYGALWIIVPEEK